MKVTITQNEAIDHLIEHKKVATKVIKNLSDRLTNIENLSKEQNKTIEQRKNDLIEFYDNEGHWQNEYSDNDDFIENYAECLYHGGGELYTGELDDDIKYLVEYLNDDSFILDHCEATKTHGIHRVSNEVMSMNIGEIELQLDDQKLPKLLKGLSNEEIKDCQNASEYYIDGEYLYIDMSYDRVSLILNEDSLIESLK